MAQQALAADARAPVDVLIANAGLGGDRALAGTTGERVEQATALVNVNFVGMLNTVTPLVPPLVERGRGRIVLIGSIAGLLGLPASPTYCATKAAVHVYGEALRRRLRSTGVGVTVACPGFVETPMSASLPTARPFLWSADRAAARIARAIEHRRPLLVFPWQLHAAIVASRLLPRAAIDRLLSAPYAGVVHE
jgi:short-subunit dehydrogenase